MDLLKEGLFFAQRGPDLLFRGYALRDVAQDDGEHCHSRDAHFRDGGLSRKLAAILAPATDLAALTHAARCHVRISEVVDMLPMDLHQRSRQEYVEMLSDDLLIRVSKDLF